MSNRRPHPRAGRSQRGAAVLEMVLVVPLLALLALGVGEFGMAWTNANKLEGAVSTAARVGSVQGATAGADAAILTSLRAAMPEELIANVTRVVVYESNSSGYISPTCRTASAGNGVNSGANQCNIYNAATLASASLTMTLDESDWAPSERQDNLSETPDYLGVLVITRHDDISGTFWRNGFVLERTSIYRIQPDIDG